MPARRAAAVALVLTAALLAPATPARAGAPNYECAIGSYRIGIDQHRRTGLVRRSVGPVMSTAFTDVNQDGPTLGLVATIGGRRTRLDVTGTGAAATLTTLTRQGKPARSERASGACAFVPGDFALGVVTARSLVLRADPTDDAAVVTVIGRSSLVWSSGRFDETTKTIRGTEAWTHFRVILHVRGGAAGGGEQTLGMGASSGLDGRSTMVEGWGLLEAVDMTGPPGP